MEFSNLRIAFYIRGETPRTISKQYLTLQQFCFDYRVPFGDIIVVKDIAKSEKIRPSLQAVLNGEIPIDILVTQSYHILHIDHEQFLNISEQLTTREIALLLVNVVEKEEALDILRQAATD
jgi:hypothetical protein